MSGAASERIAFAPLAVFSGLLIWGSLQCGPVMVAGEVELFPAAVLSLTALTVGRLVAECLVYLACFLDWIASHRATGKSGTARWGRYKELKKELCSGDEGPFWGLTAKEGKKLFLDFVSNAFVVGPAGSGKGHTVVVLMILLIRHSKIIIDYKPELLCICKKPLEQLGQVVIFLNPFRTHTERVGEGQSLNVLDVITDDLYRSGGLRNVFSDSDELALQLYQDPPDKKGDDQYWRNGTRKIIAFVATSTCMMQGYQGTLTDMTLLLDNPVSLELHLCSIVGVDVDGNHDPQGPYLFEMSDWSDYQDLDELQAFLHAFRAKAAGLLKQIQSSEKTFASFLEGAQQSVAPYGFGELSGALGPTTFDFDSIKSGGLPVNLFVVGDASRNKATEKFFEITQWYMQLKLKRHPNKHVPVYLVYDEINNYSPYGYISLLSWARGFGIRTLNFLQNFTAFEEKHGKQATDVLISESQIQLYLPGQRSISTIKKIVELLGKQSVMAASLVAEKDGSGLRENLSESERMLMTEDEVRRSQYGILFVRDKPPFLQQPISYSEIDPLREWADINPHHGKPFLNKVKLKLKLPKKED